MCPHPLWQTDTVREWARFLPGWIGRPQIVAQWFALRKLRSTTVAVSAPSNEFEGDPEYAPMWAGASISVVNDIKPAPSCATLSVKQRFS